MRSITETIWKILLPIAATLFAVGTIITFVNVVLRRAFNAPWAGTEELSSNLLMAIVFLPLAFVEMKNKQLTVSALYDLFPPKVQFVFRKLQHLVILALSLFLTIGAWDLVAKNIEEGNKTLVMGLPIYLLYLIIFIGFGLMVLVKILQLFTSEKSGEPHAN